MRYSRHNYFMPNINDDFFTRLSKTYYCFAGRRITAKNHRSFEFGLLDLTIAPIIAHYLWQYSQGKANILFFRQVAGVIAVPILLIYSVIAAALTIASAPLSLLFHQASRLFRNNNSQPYDTLPTFDPTQSHLFGVRLSPIPGPASNATTDPQLQASATTGAPLASP